MYSNKPCTRIFFRKQLHTLCCQKSFICFEKKGLFMLVGPAFQLLDKAKTIRNHIRLILFLD